MESLPRGRTYTRLEIVRLDAGDINTVLEVVELRFRTPSESRMHWRIWCGQCRRIAVAACKKIFIDFGAVLHCVAGSADLHNDVLGNDVGRGQLSRVALFGQVQMHSAGVKPFETVRRRMAVRVSVSITDDCNRRFRCRKLVVITAVAAAMMMDFVDVETADVFRQTALNIFVSVFGFAA